MFNLLKYLVMAIAALAEQAFLPDQRCVRGAGDASLAARRREKTDPLANCEPGPQEAIAGVEP